MCKQKHVVMQHCQLCGMQWHILSLAALLLRTFEIFGTGTSLYIVLQTKQSLELGWGTPQASTLLKSKEKANWLQAWDWKGKEFTRDNPESFISFWQLCFQAIYIVSCQETASGFDTSFHLHFCSRYKDPYFCHTFSCVSLIQPEQPMWLCFFCSWHVQLSPFLLTLDHFLDVLYSLISNTTCCSKDKDFQWRLKKHNCTQCFLQKASKEYQWNWTSIVFRKFNQKRMLVIFMERTVSIRFKITPKLLDLCTSILFHNFLSELECSHFSCNVLPLTFSSTRVALVLHHQQIKKPPQLESCFVSTDPCRAFNTSKSDLVFLTSVICCISPGKNMLAKPLHCGPYVAHADELLDRYESVPNLLFPSVMILVTWINGNFYVHTEFM